MTADRADTNPRPLPDLHDPIEVGRLCRATQHRKHVAAEQSPSRTAVAVVA